VLGLNEVPESSLGLVFHFADQNGLPLLDPKDLRAVIQYLISDEGGTALQSLGGLSKQTAGVLLRELVTGYDWRSCSPRSAPARRSSPCCRTGAHRPRGRFRWGGCPAGGASSQGEGRGLHAGEGAQEPAAKSFARTAASAAGRAIMRSVFGTARR